MIVVVGWYSDLEVTVYVAVRAFVVDGTLERDRLPSLVMHISSVYVLAMAVPAKRRIAGKYMLVKQTVKVREHERKVRDHTLPLNFEQERPQSSLEPGSGKTLENVEVVACKGAAEDAVLPNEHRVRQHYCTRAA